MTINLTDYDKSQRQLALDASKSFIVQAPAGSGKTELLIQRFLTLLKHVKTPEEILAITFTKKASSEMRSRVISALKQAQSEPEPATQHGKQTWLLAKEALERDKQFNWNLIENPNQLCIQTIDSLCAFLTRQLPILSQFGSSPEIAVNPDLLYREAVQEVLMHVEENYEWSQSIAELLLHLDNDLNKLHDLLINLLAKRDQWLPYIHFNKQDSEIKKQLEQHLANVIGDTLNTLREIFPQQAIPQLTAIARFAADNLALANPDSPLIACRNLTDLPGSNVTDTRAWLGLAQLLLTKQLTWRKCVNEQIGFPPQNSLRNAEEKFLHADFRQQHTHLIGVLYENEALRSALAGLFFLPDPFYQKDQWKILQALLHVLKIVAAQLRVTFEQHGQIDFIENAQAALAALGNEENPTDLALALDYQIRHILVDEFQDTSSTQYQLLEKLILGWEENDGRTLFVVGDPMQSIYRFREAEVGLFIRMVKNGIGNIKLIPITLRLNFRSDTTIVDWTNAHFQRIFPSFSDMATGAVQYSQSTSSKPDKAINPNSEIAIKGFLAADEARQANAIVSRLQTLQTHHPHDKTAILVRSRTHLAAIIPALKKAKIPYNAIDIDPLASRQCIQDLLSLTFALLHPADRIAWLAILRAPWCGLTLSDLFVIANENPYVTIWEQLERTDIIDKLSQDGKARLGKILPVIKAKIADRERSALRDWIEGTWLLLGGPATLNDESDLNDANAFFKLLDEFNHTNRVLSLDRLKERINQLYASTKHANDSLQIMTIHTAKGLEFDTVILPHLERKMPNNDKPLLAWMEHPLLDDQIALLLAPIHATGDDKDATYEFINRQQKIKSDYETDRLLYVATTRAKKRLYLFFNAEQKESGDYKTESGSFLEKLWPHLSNKHAYLMPDEEAPLTEVDPAKKTGKLIVRLQNTWNNPINENKTLGIAAHQKQAGFQLRDRKPTVIGTITHKILQQISQLGIEWWQDKNEKEHHDYLTFHLTQLGILPADLDTTASRIQLAIQNTLQDERGLWILKNHLEAKSEFAVNALIEGNIERLVIDRTFIDESGLRWIIDYKTTTFTSHDLDLFLANEQQKYLEKMIKYHEALRMMDDRPTRLGLYFPALPAWKEWAI